MYNIDLFRNLQMVVHFLPISTPAPPVIEPLDSVPSSSSSPYPLLRPPAHVSGISPDRIRVKHTTVDSQGRVELVVQLCWLLIAQPHRAGNTIPRVALLGWFELGLAAE